MSRRPQRLAFGGRGLVLSLFAGMVIATAVGASAASLGGIQSESLYSVSIDQTVPTPPTTVPQPVACDSFSTPAPTKNEMNGRPLSCGSGTWTVNTGDWKIAGGRVRANGAGQVTVVAPTVDISAEVSMSHFDGNNRVGGLILNRSNGSGTASMLTGVIIGPNSVAIRLVNGTAVTTLATGTIPNNLDEARLRFTRLGNAVTLRVNGVIVASATLTPSQLPLLTGTRAGIYQLIGNSLRYWDFALYPASP